jgi:hypothetical protein
VCGSTRFLVVDHRDGDKHNDQPGNLRWLCKSDNTRLRFAMARDGQARRTRQYNPAYTGAAPLGEYVSALRILHANWLATSTRRAQRSTTRRRPDGRSSRKEYGEGDGAADPPGWTW